MRINPIFKQLAEGSIYLTAFGLVVWSMNRPHDDSFYHWYDSAISLYIVVVTSFYAINKLMNGNKYYGSILVLASLATMWHFKDYVMGTYEKLGVTEIMFAVVLIILLILISIQCYLQWKGKG